MTPLKLYTFVPKDRSGKIRWLLEELGTAYEIRALDGEKGENETPEHLELHPMGRVPVLVDGQSTLFESGAICLYLTEKFPNPPMAPPIGSPQRGDFLKWILFSTVTMDPLLIEIFKAKELPTEARARKLKEIGEEFKPIANALLKSLAGREYLVGGDFSAADIMIAQPLYWAKVGKFLAAYPALGEYLERLASRPACKHSKVFG